MLTEEELNLLADVFADRFGGVGARILQEMAQTLKKTGDMIPAYAERLQQMYAYGYDVELATKQLARESGMAIEEIEKLYESVAREGYSWSKPFYEAKGVPQIPLQDNAALQSILQSAAAVTKKELRNMSRTTAVGIRTKTGFEPLGSFYKKTVDKAITAAATGVESHQAVIRQAIKDVGSGGLRVKYESGYTKRLDSAIRQNILDGISYVAQETARRTGEEFGADGVELSAHSPCAPDHVPYQGLQFSMEEYAALQQSLSRPFGDWNCRHIAYSIILGISHPAHGKKELAQMKRYSNEKIIIDGQEYTRYECTQLQRKMETGLRYAKEEKQLYQGIEDKDLIRGATEKIRLLSNKYAEVSEKAGLPIKAERTRVIAKGLREKNIQGFLPTTLPKDMDVNIPIEKFTKYALNKERDYNKAIAFERALGYTINNAEGLVATIKKNARRYPAKEKSDLGYGKRYEVIMTIIGPNGKSASVKTAWIHDNDIGEVRLTSAYITNKKRKEE